MRKLVTALIDAEMWVVEDDVVRPAAEQRTVAARVAHSFVANLFRRALAPRPMRAATALLIFFPLLPPPSLKAAPIRRLLQAFPTCPWHRRPSPRPCRLPFALHGPLARPQAQQQLQPACIERVKKPTRASAQLF
mmetsp:Transcript_28924/g.88720  ORF Transcript_28924/g.88720 Transcript_28924/m.88720 type:complete len:135 (+) Transcript_28924:2690-3094(+)